MHVADRAQKHTTQKLAQPITAGGQTRTALIQRAAATVLSVACLWSCSARRDPRVDLDHAKQVFRHGDIAAAGREADRGPPGIPRSQ